MKINLDDNGMHLRFAPLTLTRPVGDLRCGIFTNAERWKFYLPESSVYFQTEKYLKAKFPNCDNPDLTVNACLIPDELIVAAAVNLEDDEVLVYEDIWLAKKGSAQKKVIFKGEKPLILENRWDIFEKNHLAIQNDFSGISQVKQSQQLSETNILIGSPDFLFIEEGATIEGAILNTTQGPIYIGKGAEIMEGSMVRGPLALCEEATLKMGAKVYGATTIGPHCKVGGEISNVVFQAFSNKGHDGFLGNSLIGEWCNLGADTNTSNLKNNYSMVSTYSYETQNEQKTNVQFMGLTMGDHSKCGINTMFNTASVVGVFSNIFGSGFPKKFVPSFQWGSAEEMEVFQFEKALVAANNMMGRRSLKLSEADIQILRHIFDHN
jgi:UDP-N-acetylglucosamine diphosphorylase/glucosamine-1-phosphate N-acetyltransferase